MTQKSIHRLDPLTNLQNYSSNLDDDLAMAEALIKEVYARLGYTVRSEAAENDLLLHLAEAHSRLALAHATKEQYELLLSSNDNVPWNNWENR